MDRKKIIGLCFFSLLIIVGIMPVINGMYEPTEYFSNNNNKNENNDWPSQINNILEKLSDRLLKRLENRTIFNLLSNYIHRFRNKFTKTEIKDIDSSPERDYTFKEYYPGAPRDDPRVVYFAADEVIVRFYNKEVSEVFTVEGASVIDREQNIDSVVVKVTNMPVQEYIDLVEEREDVKYAKLNILGFSCGAPGDPHWDKQWGNKAIKCEAAWDKYDGSGVKIAMLDSGLDLDHEDIETWRCSYEYNYVVEGGSEDITDDHFAGHGTHCTGIIMADHDNKGIAGVAPNCEIIPIKVIDQDGVVKEFDFVQGLFHAIQVEDVDIICACLSFDLNLEIIEGAIDAISDQVLIIASIGHGGKFEHIHWPAAYPNVVAVGGVRWKADYDSDEYPDPNEIVPYIENSAGIELDLVAPAFGIYSTLPGGNYGYLEGTSAATAFVAGVAALYYDKYPNATPAQCRDKLNSSTTTLSARPRTKDIDIEVRGWNKMYGNGLVNAYKVIS